MSLRLFLLLLIIFSLFVMPSAGDTEGIVHYPISGITVMPGNPEFISDETDDPIVEVTEFDFSIPSFVELFLDTFHIHDVPVWAAETIVIIIGIITTMFGLITSGYLFFLYSRRRLSEDPESRHMIILAYLQGNPGAQQTEILNATGFSRGSVSYNLRKLLQEGKVSLISSRYYPTESCPEETDAEADRVLGNAQRKRIFQIIAEHPGISRKELSKELQISVSTLRWHLGKLTKAHLVLAEMRENSVCYVVHPEFAGQEE